MVLIGESVALTYGKKPCRLQIWKNHHEAYEGHVFTADSKIFSSYDQESQDVAVSVAMERAEKEGY